MKFLLLFFCHLFLIACTISRKVKRPEQPTNHTIGIVHISESNCRLFIEVINEKKNSVIEKLYSVNLNDNYQKKGLKLSFVYTASHAMSPENCAVDLVVVMDSIKVIP